MKKADFLNKYDTVIFDMDGVITEESHYWDSAALTVWQYTHPRGTDAAWCMDNIKKIRSAVFMDDKIIVSLKNRGVNSNWDLGYVTYLLSVICGGDAEKLYEMTLGFDNILDVYDDIAKAAAEKDHADFSEYRREGRLWNDMVDVFQEWFLGDELFREIFKKEPTVSGKRGLIHDEMPIIPMKRLKMLFDVLQSENINICMATGRPFHEIYTPMKEWGMYEYFKKDGFITYDTVVKAEKELKKQGIAIALTKPAPYMFLKALFGEDYPDRDIIDGNYDKTKIKKALAVGDAGADIIAAKSGGFDFAAVLTGIAGESARGYFEEMNADYILNNSGELIKTGEDKMKITTPLSKETAEKLKIGDSVLISGIIYTARDAAHERMVKNYEKTGTFPIELEGQIIYYAGPCPAKPGEVIGSCGPTTSGRMDKYTPLLLEHGLCAMLGKGGRNEEVIEAIKRNKAVYFGALGGAGALIAESIEEAEIIAYEDLGTEAIRRLKVKNLPAVVLIDAQGNNLYQEGRKKYAQI